MKAGRIKVLAIDGTTRSPLAPEVPTLHELGYRGLPFACGSLVRAEGTPRPILARLQAEFTRAASSPAFRDQHLIGRGLDPIFDTPERFAQFLREDACAPSVW